ncbi:MAG: hypothetical protein ACLQVD_08910 [Capsulimonadaceae bacterium]
MSTSQISLPQPAFFTGAFRDLPASSLLERLEFLRLDACRQLEQNRRGEFLTPAPVARLMASTFNAA